MNDAPSAGGGGGERIFVGLGANLGDAAATLHESLAALAALPGTVLVAISAFYRSAPVDAQGPDFVNAVAELRSVLGPAALLAAMQAIERSHGRQRPYRNAPRTLDLDLLLYGERRVAQSGLEVPHPRMHLRAFVLAPLADLAPEVAVGTLGTAAALLPAVAGQRIERL